MHRCLMQTTIVGRFIGKTMNEPIYFCLLGEIVIEAENVS